MTHSQRHSLLCMVNASVFFLSLASLAWTTAGSHNCLPTPPSSYCLQDIPLF